MPVEQKVDRLAEGHGILTSTQTTSVINAAKTMIDNHRCSGGCRREGSAEN